MGDRSIVDDIIEALREAVAIERRKLFRVVKKGDGGDD